MPWLEAQSSRVRSVLCCPGGSSWCQTPGFSDMHYQSSTLEPFQVWRRWWFSSSLSPIPLIALCSACTKTTPHINTCLSCLMSCKSLGKLCLAKELTLAKLPANYINLRTFNPLEYPCVLMIQLTECLKGLVGILQINVQFFSFPDSDD